MMIFGTDVLRQQTPVDDAAFHDRLKHGEDIAVHLRLVSYQRAGGVQNSRIDLPATAGLEPIGARVKQNSVVALVPIFQTAVDVVLGCTGLEAHEGVWEIVFGEIVLGRKIIRLGLAALSYQAGERIALMHV